MSELDRSYAHCRAVVGRSSSNLAWCFWLLPRDQRRGMDALYAFSRQADDLVDRSAPLETCRAALNKYRTDFESALAGDARPPLFPAVADAVRRFAIEPDLLRQLLDGMESDLTRQPPHSFAELHTYCYRVAAVVGLACLPIWGCTDRRALPPAIDCGIAFQLTNILRDLAEDAQRGRCYLPLDELQRFGVDPIGKGDTWEAVGSEAGSPCIPAIHWTWGEPLAELIEFQFARTKHYYESAAETARYLPPPGRRVFALMLARYRSILTEIERDPQRIVQQRVVLSWPRKVGVALRALVTHPTPWAQDLKPGHAGIPDPGARTPDLPRVAVLGGGLAGLAAAVALCQRGIHVELFEARQKLGGRAGSHIDRESGELIDHCQHVAMGCCTSFVDFCQQTRLDGLFSRHATLHFIGPDGMRCGFGPTAILPAPLHLGPALFRQFYLTSADRRAVAQAMFHLARRSPSDDPSGPTIGEWLRQQGQSPAAIERFWQVVLVSALGESLDRASFLAARQVFVDGFLSSRKACEVLIPTVPLSELYDQRVASWLRKRGVTIHLACGVKQIVSSGKPGEPLRIAFTDGSERRFDQVIAALPWRRLPEVLSPDLAAKLPDVFTAAQSIIGSPITGIHLWFDHPITDLPHAVVVGRLVQWVFARPGNDHPVRQVAFGSGKSDSGSWYYQVVVSASHNLEGRDRDDVLAEVLADLRAIFPQSRQAMLIRWRMITDHEAVFSVRPGLSGIRPSQQTTVTGLFLAGDWTATHWPATMEGAVRSGYLAAEALLVSLGRRQHIVPPDLPRGWLARCLIGGD